MSASTKTIVEIREGIIARYAVLSCGCVVQATSELVVGSGVKHCLCR